MTALIITAAIALLLFLLLASSITAELEYDKVFKFKIKYLFFTIAKDPLSPKEQKKKKRKAEKKKRREEKKAKKTGKHIAEKKPRHLPTEKAHTPEAEEKERSEALPDNLKSAVRSKPEEKKQKKKSGMTPELIFRILGKAKPHIKRLFKKIRVTGVYADITVGGGDAAKTAISYGVHCAAVDGLAAFLNGMITFKAEEINIRADFELEKSVYYAKATVKLRLSTLLHSGLWGAAAVYGELKELNALSEKAEGSAPPKAA